MEPIDTIQLHHWLNIILSCLTLGVVAYLTTRFFGYLFFLLFLLIIVSIIVLGYNYFDNADVSNIDLSEMWGYVGETITTILAFMVEKANDSGVFSIISILVGASLGYWSRKE